MPLEKPPRMPSRREIQRLAKSLLGGFLEIAVREGQIDPRGKSDVEILKDLQAALLPLRNRKNPILWTTDHTPNLLSLARGYRKSNTIYLACVFYAIWFEHQLNRTCGTSSSTCSYGQTGNSRPLFPRKDQLVLASYGMPGSRQTAPGIVERIS
jgi:hypothetical protein